jgi:hypothetical protein
MTAGLPKVCEPIQLTPLLGLFLFEERRTIMNNQIYSPKYQQLAEELSNLLGYNVADNLQDMECSELAKLRESLRNIEAYLHHSIMEN